MLCFARLLSHVRLCDPMSCSPTGSSVHGDSPGKNIGVGCHALLQGFFPTQGLNPGLPHRRQILYYLSHQGSPRMLEWVACPFSRGSSWPRNRTGVSCTAGRPFTSWSLEVSMMTWKYSIWGFQTWCHQSFFLCGSLCLISVPSVFLRPCFFSFVKNFLVYIGV